MSEKFVDKISELREIVNTCFSIGFKKKLIKENERGIAKLKEDCDTQEDFIIQIANLATLIDDFDKDVLKLFLREDYEKLDSVNYLEKFLEEKGLEKINIIENLRCIKRIRSTLFPIHRGTSKEFFSLMKEMGFNFPYDWNSIWKYCLRLYVDSLTQLSNQLDEYLSKIKYEKADESSIKKSEVKKDVVYLNDFLYKYRVLVPIEYKKYEWQMLVDYLTAALIAYDKKLKSINYALKKYAIPWKEKFREHTEDPFFVKKRRFIDNELLRTYGILLSRDDIGIVDDKEFQRYFRYVYASIVAYQMGVTPDWLIKGYRGPSYLDESYTQRK